MAITFRVPRWRARLALAAGMTLAAFGWLTEARLDQITAWVSRGVKVAGE
jgi:hypothetical protein